jgi:hypothetical protein
MSDSNNGGAYVDANGKWQVFTKAKTMESRPNTVVFTELTAQELVAMRKGEAVGFSTEHHTAEQVLSAMLAKRGNDLLLNPTCCHLVGFDAYDQACNPKYVKKKLPNGQPNPEYRGEPKYLHDISAAKLLAFMQGEGKGKVVFEKQYSKAQFKFKKGSQKTPKHEVEQLGGLSI